MLNNMPVIALEEHYWDAEMVSHFPSGENKSHVSDLLTEIGDVRLRAMDDLGPAVVVVINLGKNVVVVERGRRARDGEQDGGE